MITDDQSLKAASCRNNPLPTYDDGYGPLFVYSNEFGPVAVIRAQIWEDAYEIAEDEYMPGAMWEDVLESYPDAGEDDDEYLEAFGHRPNGPNGPDDEGIYHKSDYERLERLSPVLAARMEITVEIADPEPEPEPPARFHSFHLTRRPMGRRGLYIGIWSGRYGTKGSHVFACHKRRLATHDAW